MRTRKGLFAANGGERPRVIVTISAPGGVIRLSDAYQPLGVEDTDTETTYQYIPGIYSSLSYDEDVDLFRLTARSTIRNARIIFSAPGINAAEYDDAHFGLSAATVEIALLWDTETWGERTILIDGGQVTALELGIGESPSIISVEAGGPATSASIVDAGRSVGDDFPTLGYSSLAGVRWPVVVGKVYGVPGYKLGVYPTTNRALGLAGHALAPDVQVSDILIYEDGVSASMTGVTLSNTTDSGGDVAILLHSAGGVFDSGTGAYTVDFTAGGIANFRRPARAAVTAADVLETLLGLSGERIDWNALEECLYFLRDWTVGVYCNDVRDGLSVIRERLVPVLPIIEDSSARGVFFRYADPTVLPVTRSLTYGQELVGRISGLGYTDLGEIRNRFTVEYAYDSYLGRYLSSLVIDETNNELCRYSQQLYGVREADPIKVDCTWSDETARRIGMQAATRKALPRRVMRYLVEPSLYWLRAGTVVAWSDSDAGLTNQRAIIRSAAPMADPLTFTLEAIDRAPASRL